MIMAWKHLHRITAALLLTIALALGWTLPALAQGAQESAQMRLYIQQLEAQIRQLTGEVERLGFDLRQARAGLDTPPGLTGTEGLTGALGDGPISGDPVLGGFVLGGTVNPQSNASITQGAPPQDLGSLSIAIDDPRIAADGAWGGAPDGGGLGGDPGGGLGGGAGGAPPLDLSVLAGGAGTGFSGTTGLDQGRLLLPGGLAPAPPLTAALSGSARDEYDLSYGYILTGDYDLAEQSFRAWLETFPDHDLALDGRFWLAESLYQQGKNREAANGFLEVYKGAPDSRKAPNALMRLGVSLAALGERDAACATFSEMDIKFPDASSILTDRVAREAKKAGC
jgi:tol-pal system protein YbgF